MKTITNTRFDEERALYGAQNVLVRDCAFDGPADGESGQYPRSVRRRDHRQNFCNG